MGGCELFFWEYKYTRGNIFLCMKRLAESGLDFDPEIQLFCFSTCAIFVKFADAHPANCWLFFDGHGALFASGVCDFFGVAHRFILFFSGISS